METIQIIYKYGHFYDKKTSKRIIVKDETELAVVLPSKNSLLENDPLNAPLPIRTNEQQEAEMKKLKGFKQLKKIVDKGTKLTFTLTSSIITTDNPKRYTIKFGLTLMEDLYIYETSKISFSQSYCIVDKVLDGDLPFFEPLHAYSLNEAHHKTFVHFFNKFGHGTGNAFTKFILPNGKPLKSIKSIGNKK